VIQWFQVKFAVMTDRLAFALEAAYRGGRSTLGHFQNQVSVDHKSDESPVTVADRNSERIIREMIAEKYPHDYILGEEEGGDHSRPDRWIIDPIDGTKVFIAGVPLYSTLLSYEIDFQPVVGICFFPALGEMVYAETGSGAFFNGRPCRVSTRPTMTGGLLTFSGPKRLRDFGLLDGVLKLSERAADERTWNDAYGHALVATGRAEAMVDTNISLWDISALTLIVAEAGGKATSLTGGSPLHQNTYGKHDFITTNGLVHDEVLAALNGD
jgi:histidinol phosphatase-like enzyme (inositol monophosphatase family)